MITTRRTRDVPTPPPATKSPPPEAKPSPPEPQPVERELVVVTTKELRERCSGCGALVIFRVLRTRDQIRYVQCPACGRDHAINVTDDTIRPINR